LQVLCNAGWHVIAASNSKEEIDAFEKTEGIDLKHLDVTDNTSVNLLFSKLNVLDGLVNCAGILQRGAEYDLDVFQKVIDVNLIGTMRCCTLHLKAVLPS